MLQQLINAYHLLEVSTELAIDASKKQMSAIFAKAEECKEKAKECPGIDLGLAIQGQFKEKFAWLRQASQPFEQFCDELLKLLLETAEIKEKLIATKNR